MLHLAPGTNSLGGCGFNAVKRATVVPRNLARCKFNLCHRNRALKQSLSQSPHTFRFAMDRDVTAKGSPSYDKGGEGLPGREGGGRG